MSNFQLITDSACDLGIDYLNSINVKSVSLTLKFDGEDLEFKNDDIDPKSLDLASDTKRIQDLKGNHLLLFTSYWSIDWALDHNKGLELREFGTN